MILGIVAASRKLSSVIVPITIGEPFGGGYYAGDITYPDGNEYYLVVSAKSGEESLMWKTIETDTLNAYNMYDGVANMDAIKAEDITIYIAAEYCDNYQVESYDDWYLPANNELYVIYQNLNPYGVNTPEAFKVGNAEAFSVSGLEYWSSTKANQYAARYISFWNGSQSWSNLQASNFVRPVRRIKKN